MTDKQFNILWDDALTAQNREAYVSDWSLSPVWGDGPEADAPPARIEMLTQLWDAAHLSVRDIRVHTGLSQRAFATRYCISRRTVENWESGSRQCPDFIRLLLAQICGCYRRPESV